MSRGEQQTTRAEKLRSGADASAAAETETGSEAAQAEHSAERLRLRSKRGVILLIALVALLLIATIVVVSLLRANGRSEPDPIPVTVPVALSGVKTPADTKIGVVITVGAGVTQGAEWSGPAQGAIVAQHRLALGGSDIELLVEDDSGTAAGAEEAVRSLVDQGVSGIVYASAGRQLESGLAAAAEFGVPVILPYAAAPAESTDVWSIAPDDSAVGAALTRALDGFERPLLIDAGGGLPDGVRVSDTLRFASGADAAAFAAEVSRRVGGDPFAGGVYAGGQQPEGEAEAPVANPADVVVVSGHPVLQASVVYALQARNVSVPVVLTPQAVSPVFDATLVRQGGSVSSNLRTVGAAWDDAEALRTAGQGRAVSAYLAAVRQFAGDESVTDLTGDAPFAESAAAADVRSHDAVLAFAEAIASAGSSDPAKVRAELGGLRVAAGNGIAGPELDFTSAQALTGEVTVLYATAQQLGLRPQSGERPDALVWITEPSQP